MSRSNFRVSAGIADFLERTLQRYRVSRQFRAQLGYAGNFTNPTTYHEKVQFRKLFGNHDFYALVADKYRVRDYVRARIGSDYLKPLLGVYPRLGRTLLESLPRPFIVKANNGCKWHRIVRHAGAPDWDEIVAYFDDLRHRRYGRGTGELHYDYIPYRILAEPLLQDEDGGLPWDYEVWCFNTPAGFRYLPSIGTPQGGRAAFDEDWNYLQGTVPPEQVSDRINPRQFPQILQLARALSAEFDFVRVDFSLVNGKVYFGELTCTPGQGYTVITSPRRMELLTQLWHLDALNERLYRAPRAYGHAVSDQAA